ncbi:MAG: oligosaccharide flippase family protein [Chloroflexota bacterium]
MDSETESAPAEEQMDSHIERGLRWAAIRQVVLFVVGTAGILAYTRSLGPEGIGRFSIAFFVYGALRAVAQAPFRDAVVYYRKEIYSHAVFICLMVFGVLAIGLTLLAAPLIAAYYESPETVMLIRVICVMFFFYSLSVVPAALLLKTFRFDYHETLLAVSEVVFTGVVIFLLWLGWDVWALAIAHVARAAFWAAASWWAAGYTPRWVTDWPIYKDILGYSGSLMGSEIISYVNGNADNAAVGTLGEKYLGLYTFGENNSSFMVLGIGLPISQITLPALAAVRHKADQFRKVFSEMIRLASIISTPGHIGAWLLADYIIVVFFGVDWLEALWVIRAYFTFRMFNTLLTISNVAVSAYGRPDLRLKQDMVQLPLFLGGIWLGLNVWGTIEAVAWVLVAVRITMAFFYFGLTVYFTPITWGGTWATLRPSVLSGFLLGGFIFLARFLNPLSFAEPTTLMTALIPLLVYTLLGIGGYVLVYYWLDPAGFREVVALGRRTIGRKQQKEPAN